MLAKKSVPFHSLKPVNPQHSNCRGGGRYMITDIKVRDNVVNRLVEEDKINSLF